MIFVNFIIGNWSFLAQFYKYHKVNFLKVKKQAKLRISTFETQFKL